MEATEGSRGLSVGLTAQEASPSNGVMAVSNPSKPRMEVVEAMEVMEEVEEVEAMDG
jgi:hypothetical protein